MKFVAVFLISSCVFINALQIQDRKNKMTFPQSVEVFLPTEACEYQLVEPLDALLYADLETFNEVCNGSEVYFHGCRDPTLLGCLNKLPDAICSTYMYWIDAFVAGGRRFTCINGYENITEIFENHGGESCTQSAVSSDLSQSIDDIRIFLSAPKSIACSDMTLYMNATLTLLDSCENKSLMELVQAFFEQVLDFSPCPDDAVAPSAGAGAPFAANAALIISAVLFFNAISNTS